MAEGRQSSTTDRRSPPDADPVPGPSHPVTLPMPGGRTLRIRPVEAGDLEGLTQLFAQLDERDLYRRFFQARVPGTTTLERMVTPQERGGLGFVAEVQGAGVPPPIVAEATCEPLPNGDGELGITVLPRWRGWLGAYLMDLIASAAAQRGMPNLEAEILLENRPMLAVVRARGYVTMDHAECPGVVRVAIAGRGHVPVWPGSHDRRRVLVEAPGGRWYAEAAARRAGFDVLVCSGPRPGWPHCPAMRGEPCPLARDADLVIDDLPLDRGGGELLRSHRAVHPGVPVCAELATGSGARLSRGGRHERETEEFLVVQLIRRYAKHPGGRPAPTVPA